MKFTPRYIEKPWGQAHLPAAFSPAPGARTGEVWFQADGGGLRDAALPLLVKYIFTNERLSIQVHPDDRQARQAGLAGGKQECWYILECEPDARLGIGLVSTMTPDALAQAAIDGSIERLIDWKPVRPGQFYFIPAGTVHAIGAGITLVEVQQNIDVTYRLYDYGRPRELHLAEGRAVSRLEPFDRQPIDAPPGTSRTLLDGDDAPFRVDLTHCPRGQSIVLPDQRQIWFTPLSGSGTIGGEAWAPGDCWLVDGNMTIAVDEPADALLAWPS